MYNGVFFLLLLDYPIEVCSVVIAVVSLFELVVVVVVVVVAVELVTGVLSDDAMVVPDPVPVPVPDIVVVVVDGVFVAVVVSCVVVVVAVADDVLSSALTLFRATVNSKSRLISGNIRFDILIFPFYI